MKKIWLALFSLLLLSCSNISPSPSPSSSPAPVPSPALSTCQGDDHQYHDAALYWSFCYPSTWRYQLRTQDNLTWQGTEIYFDITDVGTVHNGLFGLLLVGTYLRQDAPDLKTWLAGRSIDSTNFKPTTWGGASEALIDPSNGDHYAITKHYVIWASARSGEGNLDVQSVINQPPTGWRFPY